MTTLRASFASYQLTPGQSSLVDELEVFLADQSPCFLLKGYAGTGKTFMMKGLTDFLAASNRTFRIAAPTGRAAKVISQKTSRKAFTIHKTIYSSTDLKEYKVNDEDGTETFKFYFDLKNNDEPTNAIYIVDESSMLSNVYSEGEFFRFGSGCLLNDLIHYINFDNNDHRKKIIFIGDNAQLPPVNMNFSPALDSQYLAEHCGLPSREFELTEVVRQQAESGILRNATHLRDSLKANLFNHLELESTTRDILPTRHEDLLPVYLQACNNTIDEETIIIAYSNASVKEYNDFARNHFFPGQPFITAGDKVILVCNNYNHPQMQLLNGDFGIVKEVSPVNQSRVIKLKRKNRVGKTIELEVRLTFRSAVVVFIDDEKKPQEIGCQINENLLYSKNRDLDSDELKAIYIDFKIRNSRLRPGTKEFKDALRSDPYFNALRIKFGYAVTCHKAQGGEWKNTFLNCKTSMGYFNASYFRWLYTGITRAKEKLYTLDAPSYHVGSHLQPPRIENILPRQDLLVLSDELLEKDIPFELLPDKPFVKNIFLAVSDCLKDANLTIHSIRHSLYLEHYEFLQGTEKAVFKIHYNNQSKISVIERPTNGNPMSDRIYTLLSPLQNKEIILPEDNDKESVSEPAFEWADPSLKQFYDNMKVKMFSLGIVISNIEHMDYHEIYEFKKNGFYATYKFWYDGRKIFKKTQIIQQRTNGLTDEINSLL